MNQERLPGLGSSVEAHWPEDAAVVASAARLRPEDAAAGASAVRLRLAVTFLAFIHSGLLVAKRILLRALWTILPGDGDGDDMAGQAIATLGQQVHAVGSGQVHAVGIGPMSFSYNLFQAYIPL